MSKGNIIRRIGGESIKKARKSLTFTATEGDLTFNSATKVEMVGKESGVKFTNDYKPPLPLRVMKVDGPFDDKGKKASIIEKEKTYTYKVIQFNRTPKAAELRDLKWATQYDKGELSTNFPISKGNKEAHFIIPAGVSISKFTAYAYFKKASEDASVETPLIPTQEEVLIIVGTEQHTPNSANKMMFMGQALLTVRSKYTKHERLKILVFKGDIKKYSENVLNTFTKDVLKYNPFASIVVINSTKELINYFNTGNKDGVVQGKTNRKITEIFVFSHGTFHSDKIDYGIFHFGMDGGQNWENQYLGIDEFMQINTSVFIPNITRFYSYACRTGAGTTEKSSDPKKNQSLAQKIADHGKIIVQAFIRRSQYENTWGTENNRRTYEADHSKGTIKEKIKNNSYDIITKDPPTQKHFEDYMKTETKVDGYMWNSKGAYMLPVAGDSPSLFPDTYETFKPK